MDSRPLVRSWVRAEVEVGDRLYLVRPPTAKEALTVLGILEAVHDGETEAWQMLRRETSGWLPLRLRSTLFCKHMPAKTLAEALQGLLAIGIDTERHEEAKQKASERARKQTWEILASEMCSEYGAASMQWAWPFWLLMYAEIKTLRARREIELVSAYAAAKTGKTEAVQKRAVIGERSGDELTDEELAEIQAKSLEKLRQGFASIGAAAGEA